MTGMLRCELYRLVRTRYAWACLVLYALVATCQGLALSGSGGRSVFGVVSYAVFVSSLTAYFYADDLASGFVKNLVQRPGDRNTYRHAALACLPIIGSIFFVVGIAATTLGACALGGDPPNIPTPSDAIWALQTLLVACVLTAEALPFVFAAGSRPFGLCAGILCGLGVCGSVAGALARSMGIENLAGLPLSESFPGTCIGPYLGEGLAVPGWALYVVSLVAITIAVFLSRALFARKDVSGHVD